MTAVTMNQLSSSLLSATADETQNLTADITYLEEYSYAVASGGFADIFRAKLGRVDVAVKVIRNHSQDEEKMISWSTKIKREMRVWSMMKHENILLFLGFCHFQGTSVIPRPSPVSICPVSPWMKNGSAPRFLDENPQVDRMELLLGIVNGLSYLHSQGVVHGDLKGENILITDKGTPVLADFGLATFDGTDFTLVSSSTGGGVKGTPRWMAPELLGEGDVASKVSRESDIWALGCIFLELIASMKPYAAYKSNLPVLSAIMRHRYPHESYSTSSRVVQKIQSMNSTLVEEVEPPPPAFSQYPGLWTLCFGCWSFEPSARPQCSDVLDFLAEFRFSPLQPTLSNIPPKVAELRDASDESTCIDRVDDLFGKWKNLTTSITYPEIPPGSLLSLGDLDLYKARYKKSWVAVRVTRGFRRPGIHKKALLKKIRKEMTLWSKLKHENIIPLLGFCLFLGHSISPVTLWTENGDAPNHIKNNPDTCRISLLGITNGLAYFHSRGLVHGDLRGANVLISADGRPMLSGFNSTSNDSSDNGSDSTTSLAGLIGTPRWMAPEVVSDLSVSAKSDIWALGCVFLELIASVLPYANWNRDLRILGAIMQGVLPYQRPDPTSPRTDYGAAESSNTGPPDFEDYPGLWLVCIRCWASTPSARPQCQDIQGLLTWLKYVKGKEKYAPQTIITH
ncbi:kinase-like protein [Sistotremastrum niveocremeum HHB9708]|uniref:Kinase-like protein n=1 Tax=Sistotremastrum niveocremeum HHB9708 TaxID=1314777 RepID=A0A164QHU1_9AGAM|nr:kinase-like protein [Sistotremastrum niveocremeum HHB9708]